MTVFKPMPQGESIKSTSTTSMKAPINSDVTESLNQTQTSPKVDGKDITSVISNSKAVDPAPLKENFNSPNTIIQSRTRAEKPAYIPPHLRSLMKPEEARPKQQQQEDSQAKTEKVAQDHIPANGSIEQISQEGPDTYLSKPRILLDSSSLCTSDKTKNTNNTVNPGILDGHAPNVTVSATNHTQEQSSSISAIGFPLGQVNNPASKNRSPEEIFVARTPKPRAPKKLVRVEDLLPEHLRNIPKPILMGPQVKRNAENAAKQVHVDPETVVAQVLKRNEDYYQPVVQLEATKTLIQELAAGEETPDENAKLAEDRSSMCSEDSKNISDELKAAKRAARWRWFNSKKEPSETTAIEYTPKKELRHELVAWDGEWVTPPLEWNMRGQFNNNTPKHIRWMERWVLDRMTEALNKPVLLDIADVGWRSGITPASGTPKQWQIFPEDCVANHVPLEYGPVDWDQAPTLPANDPYSHTKERENQTSLSSAKKFCFDHYTEKHLAMKEKFARRVEYAQWKREAEQLRLERAPKANIYIRPAQFSDVPQIAHLYNHYVSNTVHAPELEVMDDSEWHDRLQGAEDENLAFLVAVLKAAKKYGPGARGGRRGGRVGRGGFPRRGGFARDDVQYDFSSETIVGFSYAEDHAGMHTMYQHTVELQLFVDPNHYMKGIGKTLMDRMMTSLDKGYMLEATTDFVDDGKMCYEVGGAREIHKILVTVGFHFGEEKEFEWRKTWLEQKFEFDHIGTMNCLGKKFGKG